MHDVLRAEGPERIAPDWARLDPEFLDRKRRRAIIIASKMPMADASGCSGAGFMSAATRRRAGSCMGCLRDVLYAELVCASHYSFLRGASPPGDLIRTALQLGYSGLGLCDRNSVAGVVRALSALEEIAGRG